MLFRSNLTALQIHLENRFGTSWSEDSINKVTALVASTYAYHPVLEYLDQLPEWDGVDRFPLLVEGVLAVNETPDYDKYSNLYTEYMKCTCIGAVRRVLEPGCKMDTVTIFYSGDQGTRKSSIWKALCADPTWFSDSKVHIDSSEGQKVLHHSWINELSEIDEMTSVKSAEAIKSFVSSSVDTFRQSYAKAPRRYPRRCIIVGTTNKEQMLNDPTGSRRFWVVPVGKRCDLDLLRVHLDQLWAQAYKLCRDGVIHYLTPEFENLREIQSDIHQVENRFADLMPKIFEFYASQIRPRGITLIEILSFLEGKTEEGKGFARPTYADRRDLGSCLRIAKWTSKPTKVDGISAKRFTPPQDMLVIGGPQHQPPIETLIPMLDPNVHPFSGPAQGPLL